MSSIAFALIGDTFQARIGIWKCWFLRGENRSTQGKTSRSREENQQQTQPTYDAGSGNRTRDTLVGGERSHHCAIPAPHIHVFGSETMCSYSQLILLARLSSKLILQNLFFVFLILLLLGWCLYRTFLHNKWVSNRPLFIIYILLKHYSHYTLSLTLGEILRS